MTNGEASKSWLYRNWKWILIALLLVCILCGIGAQLLLFRSKPSQLAFAAAKASPRVIEQIGQPMKAGWLVTGSIHITPKSGRAELTIPIAGPKGRGRLHAVAIETAGNWELISLLFATDEKPPSADAIAP